MKLKIKQILFMKNYFNLSKDVTNKIVRAVSELHVIRLLIQTKLNLYTEDYIKQINIRF